MHDTSVHSALQEVLHQAEATPSHGGDSDLIAEFISHGLHQAESPLNLWLSFAKGAPLNEADSFVRLDVSDTPHGTAHAQIPVEELVFPEGSVNCLVIDGILETLSFTAALAHLVQWQSWLGQGGELRIITADIESCSRTLLGLPEGVQRQHMVNQLVGNNTQAHQDGWYRNKLQRVLQGFGLEIASLKTRSGGLAAPHLLEAHATKRCDTPLHAAMRAVKSILADALPALEAEQAYRHVELMLAGSSETPAPNVSPSTVEAPSGSATAELPLASVIVLTFNQLEDTKMCLLSIEKYTTTPYELIVVDNASTDGTREYLRAFAEERPHVKLALNETNHGFARGNNIGMAMARGSYYVLLNNDTIVSRGWLGRLVDTCRRDHQVALVGPRSNRVSGAQLVRNVSYSSDPEMQAFAAQMAETYAERAHEVIRLVGFCLLIRADVIERIGGLDERFGRGNFEDDDFCLRAYAAGFGARIAADVFIHHSGSKTFQGAGIDYRQALEDNWIIFKDKWGIAASRSLEEGLPINFEAPEGVMQFINTPDLGQTHTSDEKGILWEKPPVSTTISPDAEKSEVVRRFDEAEAAAQAGDWQGSAELFLQLVESYPTFGPGYVALASAAFAIGEVQVGLEALEHAHTIYPKNIDILLQIGVVRAHRGEYDLAEASFLKALDIESNNVDALISLAQMCRVRKHYVEAVQLIDQANQLDPTNPAVIGAIGTLAFELGDQAGAEAALNHLRQRAPEHHETRILAERITGLAEDAAE